MQIPAAVRNDAKEGLELMELGYRGGTETGWNRAQQLAYAQTIPVEDLAVMRAWFARHGPDAKNGGTSYPGYCDWVQLGKPLDEPNKHKGAVAWLIWGGDAAYVWLKTPRIRKVLATRYPKRKQASKDINLVC